MSIIKPKRIEDYIINYLKSGSEKSLVLVKKVQKDRPKTTKQAVYAALRVLKSQEQIITAKGIASLNIAWVNQMSGFFNAVKNEYSNARDQGNFLNLEDKERIKYYFHDAHKADVFWTHAYFLLLEYLQPDEPVFLYNPHEWFLLARPENESSVIKTTIGKNHPFLLTAGSNKLLDKQITKHFDGNMSQYNMLPKFLFKENSYYINIFGDFLIEAWLDKTIAEKIESLYQNTNRWDENIANEFNNILTMNGRTKIVISRNHKKAERLKKTLAKDFVVKRFI